MRIKQNKIKYNKILKVLIMLFVVAKWIDGNFKVKLY